MHSRRGSSPAGLSSERWGTGGGHTNRNTNSLITGCRITRTDIYIYAVRNARSGLRRGRCKFALSASRVSYPRSYLDIMAGALTHLAAYRLVHIMLCYPLGLYATRCKNWHCFTGRGRRHYQMSQIRTITIRPICIAKDARNFYARTVNRHIASGDIFSSEMWHVTFISNTVCNSVLHK